ncbi:MAG: SRPBCC domain-containing protein [Solirubrobacterales bacterium]|nr:SRPBCC domain-containing protein [Solirubrobacterales bacterium]
MDEVTKEVELDSEPERAWRAISEEGELAGWLGEEVEVDLVPGGEITVTDEGRERSGFVETVEEGRGIAFWWSEPGGESSRVELEVIADPERDGCVVRVTESRPLQGLERELADLTASAVAA